MDQGVVMMKIGEIERLKVIDQVLKRKLSKRAAAEQLNLSRRQMIRLCKRVKKEGSRGVIHKLRGKRSNRSLPADILDRAIKLIESKYGDFGPTLAAEKLEEFDQIRLSTSTIRRGMIEAELWKPRKMKIVYRSCRKRRPCMGELVQVDGCDHDWLEGRGPRCVLILFIDDATSIILYAEFVDSESTLNLLRLAGNYVRQHGRPIAFYVDKDSIFKINRQPTIEEQLADLQPPTQFSRAMKELDIQIICANSPQAKGRVERSFKTHQDRLVKELRLRKLSNIDEANRFLWDSYLPDFNDRFSVKPAAAANAHRPLLANQSLDEILSLRTQRTIFNDYTIRFQNRFFQLIPESRLRIRRKQKVEVEIRLDSSLHIRFNARYLSFREIKKLAKSFPEEPLHFVRSANPPVPPKDHPSRRFRLPRATWSKLNSLKQQYKSPTSFPRNHEP